MGEGKRKTDKRKREGNRSERVLQKYKQIKKNYPFRYLEFRINLYTFCL